MIGNWQHQNIPEPKRYLDFSIAYLKAGIEFCRKMITETSEQSWPNASVAMLLGAHSVELFLKGAILSKSPDSKLNNHDIESLHKQYTILFQNDIDQFDIPFTQTIYLGFTKEELASIKPKTQLPSIKFRYPVKSANVEWDGLHGFIPEQTFESMNTLLTNIIRVSESLYPTGA